MRRSRLTDGLKRQFGLRRPRLRRGHRRRTTALSPAAEQLEVRTLLTATPVMVEDINAAGASDPRYLTEVNGTVFFTASDGTNGRELWKYDGTTAEMVADIREGSGSSSPRNLTNVNGTLYFTANDDFNGRELWKHDGETTQLVADIRPGSVSEGEEQFAYSSNPSNLTNVNGTLFFTADNGANGRELWTTDGTITEMVADIRMAGHEYGSENSSEVGTDSDPAELTNVNGILFFTADDGTNGRELWKYDGTTVEIVMDIREGEGGSNPDQLTNVNGTLFFTADDGTNGRELWKSDGETTELVADIGPGSGTSGSDYGSEEIVFSSDPENLTNVNGMLFFTANDGISGRELWKSDGETTELVADIRPVVEGEGEEQPSYSSNPSHLTNVNGMLFFIANDGTHGRELWKSDGETTELVADIRPGSGSSGTEDDSGSEGENRSGSSQLTNVNGTLFFAADDGTNGQELWRSGGETTELVADIRPGSGSYDSDYGSEGEYGSESPSEFGYSSVPLDLTNVNGTLFFTADDGTSGRELWKFEVNAAPTAVTLLNPTESIEENTDTSTRIKLADIDVTDDGTGTNTFSLSGTDAASFEIIGTELFLRAGVTLDFETQTTYDVTVEVTDNSLSGGPHATTDFTLNVTDVNEEPPVVQLFRQFFGWQAQTVRRYFGWFFGW